jgi:hypothetical protein
MGHFTDETLQKFQAMCAAGMDFGEGPAYDFAMCIKADGDIYGVSPGEQCEEGKPISDSQAATKRDEDSSARMAKLRAAFIKKTGRKMNPEELKKLQKMIESGIIKPASKAPSKPTKNPDA